MYRYKEVEAALAKMHDVEPKSLGAFKGRIIHLQRVGIGVPSPGRGKKIEYTFENVAVWAFCLQLSEYGLDPLRIQVVFNSCWSIILPFFCEDGGPEDMIYYFLPNVMSSAFVNGLGSRAMINNGVVPLSEATISDLAKLLYAPHVGANDVKRIATINLSQLRRDLIAALETVAQA